MLLSVRKTASELVQKVTWLPFPMRFALAGLGSWFYLPSPYEARVLSIPHLDIARSIPPDPGEIKIRSERSCLQWGAAVR